MHRSLDSSTGTLISSPASPSFIILLALMRISTSLPEITLPMFTGSSCLNLLRTAPEAQLKANGLKANELKSND
jgi:hypothetical protein